MMRFSSTPRPRLMRAALAFGCVAYSACALLGKSEPLAPRYFTLADLRRPAPPPNASTLSLSLGRVSAGAQLRERMLYRRGDNEVVYYEDRRWTERPEVYLRRALVQALFEARGIQQVVSGAAPTLQAELLTFDEIKGEQPRVRMQVLITLDDLRLSRLTETIQIERPVLAATVDQQADAVVRAFAEALQAGAALIADHVTAKLHPPPAVAEP